MANGRLTRHRRIAEVAPSIVSEAFGEDLVGRLEELARPAVVIRSEGSFVIDLRKWEYDLPEHFLRTAPEAALRLAQAAAG